MTKHQWLWMGCAAASVLTGTACSGTDTPTANDYDDVAQALGSVTVTGDGGGEIRAIVDVSAIASGAPADGITLKATGDFSGTHLGLTYDYRLRCADAGGKALAACGSGADSAGVNIEWSGELATGVLDATVHRTGELELSQIQSGTIHIAGRSSLELAASFDAVLADASRSYALKYDADYRDLRVQQSPLRVLAGSIHAAVDVERKATDGSRTSDANFEIDAEIVFGSDGHATLTLDGAHHYAIDMQSASVTRSNK
ncbi:MAG TPA: hypothetical protein VJR89_21415 [Polyangiales bacterium]|nr:hypothetical protein [Polyangiales bacterium]